MDLILLFSPSQIIHNPKKKKKKNPKTFDPLHLWKRKMDGGLLVP